MFVECWCDFASIFVIFHFSISFLTIPLLPLIRFGKPNNARRRKKQCEEARREKKWSRQRGQVKLRYFTVRKATIIGIFRSLKSGTTLCVFIYLFFSPLLSSFLVLPFLPSQCWWWKKRSKKEKKIKSLSTDVLHHVPKLL